MIKNTLLIASLLFSINVNAQKIAFSCNTEKHTILIFQIDSDSYQYRSWNKPKPMSDKPDMDLKSKNIDSVGSCQRYYKFKTGKVEFEVTNQWSCLGKGETPPEAAKGAIGDLYVRSSGEVKSHYYCYK
jgi:hypothetical protein